MEVSEEVFVNGFRHFGSGICTLIVLAVTLEGNSALTLRITSACNSNFKSVGDCKERQMICVCVDTLKIKEREIFYNIFII